MSEAVILLPLLPPMERTRKMFFFFNLKLSILVFFFSVETKVLYRYFYSADLHNRVKYIILYFDTNSLQNCAYHSKTVHRRGLHIQSSTGSY
jgi:hypothetical protein